MSDLDKMLQATRKAGMREGIAFAADAIDKAAERARSAPFKEFTVPIMRQLAAEVRALTPPHPDGGSDA